MLADDFQNSLLKNTMNIFYSLSFYSPIIICFSIIIFSMFTATIEKAFVFLFWIFIITGIRIIAFKGFNTENITEIPNICLTGLTDLFIPKDVTYSTYILSFTMIYLIMPMIMLSTQKGVNAINFGILGFFIAYIILDLFIKNSLSCISGFFSKNVIINIFSGIFLGAVISALIMYGTILKRYLYINEINTNKEVCSVPSKQQFRCNVYKDGTLVSSSLN